MNLCILENCTNDRKSRGLCGQHYSHHKYRGTLETVALPRKQERPSDIHSLSDIHEETKTGTCAVCGPDTKIVKYPSNPRWKCNAPFKKAAKRYEKVRPYRLKHSGYFYGDGERVPAAEAKAERERLIQEQGNVCAICKEPADETLSLDHCHETGKIRGLLCAKHNRGLGFFADDPKLLQAAIDYLTT